MITDLLNSWYAMRALLQQGILNGNDDNEEQELEAIATFHDHCFTVADDGGLDQALEMGMRMFEVELAGDFYRDLMEAVSTHGHPIEGDDWEGIAKTRLFSIPVVGPLENLSRLHHDERLVSSFRASGFADEEAHVFFLGATKLIDGSRLSPQSVFNLTKAGTHALAKLSGGEISLDEIAALRALAPLIPDDQEEYEEGVHSGLLMGLRFDIEEESDPIQMDPLEQSAERSDEWRERLASIPGIKQDCVILSPMPWKEGIVHSLVVSAQVGILRASERDQETDIGRVVISSGKDHVDLSWFDDANNFLGTHEVPSEVSFWALPEIIHELTQQGAEVQVVHPSVANLATMPSPGRLLN